MGLTSDKGKYIRKEYSEVKEKEICETRKLIQIGGNRTKIDGSDGTKNESIKNFTGSSSQVHLTTQNHFIKILNLDDNSEKFVRMFCGNEGIDFNGQDRYFISDIDSIYVDSFIHFLNENKIRVIDLIIRNGFDVNSVVYRDLKTNKIYDITYDEIINKVKDCKWVLKEGGVHLKNKKNKTFFHFQREGKKKKSNRYNVLWHIHRNLFLDN
jgi:hypothetical protein